MRRKTAFTLVELLIALGIIALLIGLLLPAISRARASAARVKCAAHLRELGQAIQLYAGEYKGAVPIARWQSDPIPPLGMSIINDWYTLIGRFLPEDERPSCPLVQPAPRWMGYGMNLSPTAPAYGPNGDDWSKVNLRLPDQVIKGRFFRITEWTNPGRRGLLTETVLSTVSEETLDARRHAATGSSSGPGANVLFVDGHVSALEADLVKWPFYDPSQPF